MLTGTPVFQPPEQLRSDSIGLPSDIYALGAVLLVLFSKKPVWPKLSPYQIIFKGTVSGKKPDTTLLPSQHREVCRVLGIYCKGYCIIITITCIIIINIRIILYYISPRLPFVYIYS